MIHHKVSRTTGYLLVSISNRDQDKRYGVSNYSPFLPPRLLRKYQFRIAYFLQHTLELSPAEVEVTHRLLTFYSYYDNVFPKASQVTAIPGCSRATFWRTVHRLEKLGLARRLNRFIFREEAQISNLYHLDKLIIVLVRYLNEHGAGISHPSLDGHLGKEGRAFWRWAFNGRYTELRRPARAP